MTQTRPPPDAAGAVSNLPVLSVSELSQALKSVVEEAFGLVRVRGEISGFKRATSGHLYLSLKDADAVLDAVCWKQLAGRLGIAPEDGIEVICTGRLTTYPGRSRYQLVIERMELAGVGALMALLEKRKQKLAAEGLFAPERKRPLPYLPDTIGVVTSLTGAVIRDILHRLAERFPRHVLIWAVPVQGEGAAEKIAAAIAGFNSLQPGGEAALGAPIGAPSAPGGRVPRPDVLIVARGGGSIEDLWAFNEEIVVRAAAASEIPLISAVGHETDTTLIDFASDRRAPTPTAAAEIAVPVRRDLAVNLDDAGQRLRHALRRQLSQQSTALSGLARGLRRPRDLLQLAAQRCDELSDRLPRALAGLTEKFAGRLAAAAAGLRPAVLVRELGGRRERLDAIAQRLPALWQRRIGDAKLALAGRAGLLDSLSYRKVLERGFAVVRALASGGAAGQAITAAAGAAPGMAIRIEFKDGERDATIAGEPPKIAARRPAAGQDKDKQGSLL
jgi:exodeoxyribonuclease VII large subunit